MASPAVELLRRCFVHIPKTGGSSVEVAIGSSHAHIPAPSLHCNRTVAIARDPVERLASAFRFCKRHPWDAVLRRRGWENHCCHSTSLKRSLSEWVVGAVRTDCRMPGAGYPHSFLAPMTFWTVPSTLLLRNHCLDTDMRRHFNLSLPRVNTAGDSRYTRCPGLTRDAWNTVSKRYRDDLRLVYGWEGGNAPSEYERWKELCLAKGERCTAQSGVV